jgi:hypothetical protein
MPFAVFRRHQKVLLAVFALMAMFAFVLSDSLPNLIRATAGGSQDTEVVRLYNRSIRRSDLSRMMTRRHNANAFIARLDPRFPQFFGSTNSTRDLVDALILEHEADRLGMPADAEFANRWLNRVFSSLRPELFERIRREINENLSGEDLLEDIASQVRLVEVRRLPGGGEVTPLDVYQAYREQHEQVSALAVPFRAADYVAKVADPTDAEVRAYYDRYKDALPDRKSDTPGFKVPRRVQIEFVWLDERALAAGIRPKLTEAELRAAYAARPKEFLAPTPELPVDLFGKEFAHLTPPTGDPFREVRPLVEATLADEKAREVAYDKLQPVRDAMEQFSGDYATVVSENRETKANTPLPRPGDRVKKAAKAGGLGYEVTPPLDREQAESHGTIAAARPGTGLSDSRDFAAVFFDPKTPLYDPVELSDLEGRRYLAWKIADLPARVPPLDEIRPEVVAAWKLERARALAERDAQDLADAARKRGGDLRAVAGTRRVLTTDPVAKMTPGLMLGPGQEIPSRPNPIPGIPDPSEALRDALFGLEPKQVAVAPNQPKTVYYALGLNRRVPADFDRLYDPFGPRMYLQSEVAQDALRLQDERWMASLRARAGLPPGWTPADEAKGEPAAPQG